jgi:hypothetical protein
MSLHGSAHTVLVKRALHFAVDGIAHEDGGSRVEDNDGCLLRCSHLQPRAVVWVNSSMFCRVPGPALRELIVDTPGVGTGPRAPRRRRMAWPPQVTD